MPAGAAWCCHLVLPTPAASPPPPPLSRRLFLKGAPGEEAVLCSSSKTYAVKNVETTNLVLMVQGDRATAAPVALSSQDPNVQATPPGMLLGLATQMQKVFAAASAVAAGKGFRICAGSCYSPFAGALQMVAVGSSAAESAAVPHRALPLTPYLPIAFRHLQAEPGGGGAGSRSGKCHCEQPLGARGSGAAPTPAGRLAAGGWVVGGWVGAGQQVQGSRFSAAGSDGGGRWASAAWGVRPWLTPTAWMETHQCSRQNRKLCVLLPCPLGLRPPASLCRRHKGASTE